MASEVIEIRPAFPEEDDAALLAIDVMTWSTGLTSPSLPRERSAFFDDATRAEDVLVAAKQAEPVGYVQLGRLLDLPARRHVLDVVGLAVDPEQRGLGIGRSLVEAAIAEARRRGARKLALRVLAPNAGARRLYERCGFAAEGVLRGEFEVDGEFLDDVLMARDL